MTFFRHQHYLNKKKTKILIWLKKKGKRERERERERERNSHVYIYIYKKLLGFNIKNNGIRYYNFNIVPYFELSILLLLLENYITTQIWSLIYLSHIMVFVYTSTVYISFECVHIYNY